MEIDTIRGMIQLGDETFIGWYFGSSFGSIFFIHERKNEEGGSVFPKREFNPRSLFFFFDYFQTFAFKIKREANNAVSNRLERSKTNI